MWNNRRCFMFFWLAIGVLWSTVALAENTKALQTISLSSSGDVVITMLGPGVGLGLDTLTVNTTCSEGYAISIKGPTDRNLYNLGNSSNESLIAPINGTPLQPAYINAEENKNTWGYSVDAYTTIFSGSFVGMPSEMTEIIRRDRASAVSGDSIPVYYGASVSPSLPSGTYMLADNEPIVYFATVNGSCAVEAPIIMDVTGNPTDWTRGPVTLTILSDVDSEDNEFSFDGGETWQSSPSKTFSENQNGIEAMIRNNGNNTVSAKQIVDITKIDTTPPSITINNGAMIATLGDNTSFSSLVTVADSQSGVSTSGLIVKRNKEIISNSNYFTYPGLYNISLEVSDNVGNQNGIDTTVLVRWPTGARYVERKTVLDGEGIVGIGLATDSAISGLYADSVDTGLDTTLPFSSKYYYSGPGTANNYLSFSNHTYQILNLSVNDDIKLIGDVSQKNVRYSNRRIFESGSYMDVDDWDSWWEGGFLYYTDDSQYRTFSDSEAAHIDLATFYAGRFTKEATPTLADTINMERTSAVNIGSRSAAWDGHYALPNVSDYIKACNQMNSVYNITTSQSNSTIFKTCSYLQTSDEQWTINSKNDTDTDNDFWVLDPTILNNNRIVSRTYYYLENYRPVFYLKDDTILSGSGTSDDPYVVQEDWSWFDSVQVAQ